MLHPCCDFQCPPHPWPWPWILKVKFWKCCISGMGGPIDMEGKGCESIECCTHVVTFNPHPWPWPWIFKVKFWKCCISGMAVLIDMEQKGCESIGCNTHFVTINFDLNHDFDLGFSRKVKFWKSRISGMGWRIDMEWKVCESIECWTHVVTFNFPLTHDLDHGFSRLNFENAVSQEWQGWLTWNMADWHGTKGMWVDKMLDPCCDFQCSPLPWPWP